MMPNDDMHKQFKEYLHRIQHPEEDKCCFCGKTPQEIKEEFFQYMEHPDEEFESIELDDIVIMTYKLKKPVCAGCYFAIKKNASMVSEIIDRPMDEVW